MNISSLTIKGQATIPAPIRKFLHLRPREKIVFAIVDGSVVLRNAQKNILDFKGAFKTNACSLSKKMGADSVRSKVKTALRKRRGST